MAINSGKTVVKLQATQKAPLLHSHRDRHSMQTKTEQKHCEFMTVKLHGYFVFTENEKKKKKFNPTTLTFLL